MDATPKQIRYIQVLLKDGDLKTYHKARDLKPEMIDTYTASDIIGYILTGNTDVASHLIKEAINDAA